MPALRIPEGCDHIQIVSDMDAVTFHSDKRWSAQPFMLTDATREWPAMKMWDEAFFIKRFGELELVGTRVVNGVKERRPFGLQDYFTYMVEHKDDIPYYLVNLQFHLGSDLMAHYMAPACFQCWYNSIPANRRKHSLSWLFIGAAGSFSGLHTDVWNTSAWNAVVTGKKLWLFYPPEQGELLYQGEVNPFDPDLMEFPDFAKASPLVCIQHPGQMVFTPSNWWHAVYNLEPGISVTENFINRSNSQFVLNFFREKGGKNYDVMKEIVDKNILTSIEK
ncbi:cupin-like domain-containing protein [uncultured Chitinophaga sp.]|jgi:JmjC domain.|uniref:cupin-like domain-containing protein n=1 Tax=uncultured Chitinophaga sp. TaxID=339340 RepID=UPI002634B908|nr:cupin-like domain-containing protein [uncultured Chitinophaga sp.]